MTAIPFPLRSQPSSVRFMGAPRLVNCYPEDIGQENRSPVAFLGIPGQTQFSTDLVNQCRGGIEVPELGVAFLVDGTTVKKMASDGSLTALSGIVPGSEPVIMERGPARYMNGEVTISIASPAVVTWEGHRLAAGQIVRFATSGELPTGLAIDTDYYVIATGLTDNAFEVSATSGGSAINTSGTQSGTQTATRTEATYQVVIVSDASSHCVENDTVTRISLEEEANAVTYLGQRWVFSHDSGRNSYSELNDALDVPALNYFTAESKPDGMVRAFADGGDLFLLGKQTTEIYQSTGDSDDPFIPLSGTFIDKGCASKHSVVSFDNAPHWLGDDNVVYRAAGYRPTRISTHAVERAIRDVADKTTIRAFVDHDAGHSFYVLTCDDWTWAFDAATGVWAERKSLNRPDWRAWPYVAAFGKRIVGDKLNATLYELTDTAYDADGEAIRLEITLPDVPGELIHDRLELDLGTGAGLNVASTADGYDPQVMLTWSDDGGNTWANERRVSIGRQGAWQTRVRFTRLGKAKTMRGRRYRIAMADPVRHSIMLGDLKAEAVAIAA